MWSSIPPAATSTLPWPRTCRKANGWAWGAPTNVELSPLRGLGIEFEVWGLPGACAFGYELSPLRGWNDV